MTDAIIETSGPSVSMASSTSVATSGGTSAAGHLNPIIPIISGEILFDNGVLVSHAVVGERPSAAISASAVSAGTATTGTGLIPSLTGHAVGPGSGVGGVAGDDCSALAILQESAAKRRKVEAPVASSSSLAGTSEKLELRLGGILCCAVCLDLPKTAMYQCQMGHLMCAACFTHLLADGRLRDQVATCPNCRVEISKSTASRNLAVEKAVSELPNECHFCDKEFPSKSLQRHEQHECEERPIQCKYLRIGCQWKGPFHEASEHERNCLHPKKSGAEVMSALEATDTAQSEERKLFSTLIELLNYEKIIFNDLQMKPYRTDEYVHKLFYETSRFSAFNHQWVVKARINNAQRDPHTVNERQITYQLILKTKTSSPMQIHFFALKGPFSDMKVNTHIYKHEFTDQENESEYFLLPLPDSSECNRLLAAKAMNFRLIMFLLSK